MFMSCLLKSNPLSTFSSRLGNEIEAGRIYDSSNMKISKYKGQKRQ
jgi:hypothetical protein